MSVTLNVGSGVVGAVAERCNLLACNPASWRFDSLVSCQLANPASSCLIPRRMLRRWVAWSLYSQTFPDPNTGEYPLRRTADLRPAAVYALRTLAGLKWAVRAFLIPCVLNKKHGGSARAMTTRQILMIYEMIHCIGFLVVENAQFFDF